MSTRGAWGFRKDGKLKITYNHCDSYPTWLGVRIAEFVKYTGTEDMIQIFDRIQMVNDDIAQPSREQILECARQLDIDETELTSGKISWYWLLRGTQGSPKAYVDGLTYMIDSESFLEDGLFCEWAYIIDLDEDVVEILRGEWRNLTGGQCTKVEDVLSFDEIRAMRISEIAEYMDSFEQRMYKEYEEDI